MATDILSFQVVLEYKDKKRLKPIVDYLLDHANINFDWEWIMGESNITYRLTIEGTWAETLQEISQLCKDNAGG